MFELERYVRKSGAQYEVILNKSYTVWTFIEDVLTRTGEWGFIEIYNIGPSCEYRYGRIVTMLDKNLHDKTVISVTASESGWHRIDYLIKI